MSREKPTLSLFIFCISAIALGLLSQHLPFFNPVIRYSALFIVTSLFFFLLCRVLPDVEIREKKLLILLLLAVFIRASYLTGQVIGSDDVYRYIWDGKLQSNGINPYMFAPDSHAFDNLRSSLFPASVNHPGLRTLYFPFSEWIFFSAYQISSESIWGLKLLLLISEIVSLYGILLLLKRLKQPLKYSLLYAFCPLPVFQFAVDCHLDGFGLPLLIFGILLYLNGKVGLSSLLFGLSISVKPITAVLVPIIFINEPGWKNRIKVLLIPLSVVFLQFVPYLQATDPFNGLFEYARNWSFNGAIFEILNMYFEDNQKSRLLCAVLLMPILVLVLFSKKPFHQKIFYSFFFVLLFSPVVHPWYVAWIAVLIPIARNWSGILYTGLVSLTCFTILNYRLQGIWSQNPVFLVIEYIPVTAFAVYELFFLETRGDPGDIAPA
jgi:alpha-1,6-mannosyltransferase